MPGLEDIYSVVTMYSRLILPALALAVLYRCGRSFLREKYEPETWGYIIFPDESRAPLRHWECVLGCARSCDVIVNYPEVSRSHAVLIRDDKGTWTVHDLGSAGGTKVASKRVGNDGLEICDGNRLNLAGVRLTFLALTEDEQQAFTDARREPGNIISPGMTLFILTVFQTVLTLGHTLNAAQEHLGMILLGFGALCAAEWCYYLMMRSIHRRGFEAETLVFFLCTLGFSVTASSVPGDMPRQVLFLLLGLALYLTLGWWLRDLGRANGSRWLAGFGAIALLAVNLLLADERFGARNWIEIAGMSFQPSEFVKIVYVYVGGATLDRLYRSRNLFMYIGFSAACVGALALMGDFGTAIVFFGTFLVISYMRSGNLATVALAVSGAGLAGMLMFTIKPHIAQRFANWGHIWEFPNDGGFQQTRALSAAASGGLFGQGAGRGWLHTIVAADTDLVFCILCEELGSITALCAVLALLLLAAFAFRGAGSARSSFYVIASCAAVSMLMIQTALNVFGSTDILPFTGVTFPFVSRGGSSFASCWALLAFVKAADTRRNASFTTKKVLAARAIRYR